MSAIGVDRSGSINRDVVGVNLLWLVPGVVGGSEVSTVTTLHAIAADPPADLRHVLFALEPFIEAHPELADQFPVEVAPLSGRLKGLRVGAEQTWLIDRMRRLKVDAMHHLGGTMPLTMPLTTPLARRSRAVPTVLSIHDLQPFEFPQHFHPVKRAYLGQVVPRSVARADLILTPSDWVRERVLERFDVDPHKVRRVHHGVPPLPPPSPADEVFARYGIKGRFVLYPAITYPHKDHLTLVRAWSRLSAEFADVTLVLSGGIGPMEERISAEIHGLGLSDRVRRIGRVATPDLVALLDEAEVVAVPSRYEGFGVPLVEAMSRGRPLLAADATAVPEVVGDGGLLVPPSRVDAWTAALESLLGDPERRAQLGQQGRRRAAQFTPEANAAATLAAHRHVLGRARRQEH